VGRHPTPWLTEGDSVRLSKAFFAEIEKKYS
jgi:hypothetical protein